MRLILSYDANPAWMEFLERTGLRRSGRQLTPLGQGGRTVLFEVVAAVEVTFG
jgi:hypothetical protein